MANTKQVRKRKTPARRPQAAAASGDAPYILKLVLYTIIGTQWLWLESAHSQSVPLPVGLLIGLIFAMHEHFQVDRKIEYAVLLVAMLAGFIAHVGLYVSI
jgi:hypothetical protein